MNSCSTDLALMTDQMDDSAKSRLVSQWVYWGYLPGVWVIQRQFSLFSSMPSLLHRRSFSLSRCSVLIEPRGQVWFLYLSYLPEFCKLPKLPETLTSLASWVLWVLSSQEENTSVWMKELHNVNSSLWSLCLPHSCTVSLISWCCKYGYTSLDILLKWNR